MGADSQKSQFLILLLGQKSRHPRCSPYLSLSGQGTPAGHPLPGRTRVTSVSLGRGRSQLGQLLPGTTLPPSRDPGLATPGARALSARSREAALGRGARPGARSSPLRAAALAAPTPRAAHMERWTEAAAAGSGASVARSAGPSRSRALLLQARVSGHHGVQ